MRNTSIRKLLIIITGLLLVGFVMPDDFREFDASTEKAVLVVLNQRFPSPSDVTATSERIVHVGNRKSPPIFVTPATATLICVSVCVMRC